MPNFKFSKLLNLNQAFLMASQRFVAFILLMFHRIVYCNWSITTYSHDINARNISTYYSAKCKILIPCFYFHSFIFFHHCFIQNMLDRRKCGIMYVYYMILCRPTSIFRKLVKAKEKILEI